MRLIDADALIEHLDYVCVGGGKWGDAEKAFINAFKDFVDGEITIEPHQKGKWIDRSDGGRILYPWDESHECSQCGHNGSGAWEYCPRCGADMRPDNAPLADDDSIYG